MKLELSTLQQKIGARLKKLRLEAGFSSYEVFADKNRLSRIQYFKMEKGTNFTLKSLSRILNIHDVSVVNFYHSLSKDPKKRVDASCSDRIYEILKILELSKTELSKSLGLKNSNQINSILNRKSNISAKLAYQINKKYSNISFKWILKGEVEKYKST
tara:strand:+ start:576 stop:1049 length:474 start_codon:yes stop_codon:yes gene_type:complete